MTREIDFSLTGRPTGMACPHCDAHLQIDHSNHGREVRCPQCNETFVALFPDAPGRQRKASTVRTRSSESNKSALAMALYGAGGVVLVVGVLMTLKTFGVLGAAALTYTGAGALGLLSCWFMGSVLELLGEIVEAINGG